MMRCKEFVATITTGQEGALSRGQRLLLGTHRMMCHRCRAFEANNRVLDQVLQARRTRLEAPPSSSDSRTNDPLTPP